MKFISILVFFVTMIIATNIKVIQGLSSKMIIIDTVSEHDP